MATAPTQRFKTTRSFPKSEWIAARTGASEERSLQRSCEMSWADSVASCPGRVEKPYVEGTEGRQTLSDLFNGRSQLIVYHFVFGPWKEGCPSCSFLSDA